MIEFERRNAFQLEKSACIWKFGVTSSEHGNLADGRQTFYVVNNLDIKEDDFVVFTCPYLRLLVKRVGFVQTHQKLDSDKRFQVVSLVSVPKNTFDEIVDKLRKEYEI